MSKSKNRAYSLYTHEALQLIAALIRVARKERKLTVHEAAERAGISRGLLQRIEKGNAKCEIGVVFEVAKIVGVKLFNSNEKDLAMHLRDTEEKLFLLPKSVHKSIKEVDDDF